MVMTALFLNLFTGVLIGLPLIALVMLFAILLKLWGMVAAFHALGAWLARRWFRRRLSPLNAAMVGLLVLAAIKLIPIAGLLVWHAASFVGVGAALMTKLGRDEPWFELAAKPLTLTP
jgi:sorbitol-specific phosphotransferase system component IIBC